MSIQRSFLEEQWSNLERGIYVKLKKVNKIQILNQDFRKTLKGLPNNSVDLIITDPPYKITQRGNCGNSGGMFKTKASMKGDLFKHNDLNPEDYAHEFFRVLKDGSHCYIMTNHTNLQHMLNTFTSVGFHFVKSLVWVKNNKIMGRYYMSQFEYILFFRKGKDKQINECGTSDVMVIKNKKLKKEDGSNAHNTEKPVELTDILVRNSSQENELVCDPFLGIGAVAISCKKLNRRFIGGDIDKEYCEITNQRLYKEE